MEPFAEAYVARLNEIVSGYGAALDSLPTVALDWSPGPEMNSVAVLVTHAAAALRYVMGDVVASDCSDRVREAEFRTKGVDGTTLLQRLADAAAYAQRVAVSLAVADLGREHFSPQHQRNFTVAWCLYRSLDHLAEHMAHAQLTRLLWEQQRKTA